MNCVLCTSRRLIKSFATTRNRCVVMTSNKFSSDTATGNTGKLSGKVAIVTASTEGIGYGIAQNLAQHGASVMISSRKVIYSIFHS